jgi:hypothetical protein
MKLWNFDQSEREREVKWVCVSLYTHLTREFLSCKVVFFTGSKQTMKGGGQTKNEDKIGEYKIYTKLNH